jgi:hypothetical protein
LKEKRCLVIADNYVKQRMVELMKQQLDIDLAMVAHPGVWRKVVSVDIPIILPISFKPGDTSKYAVQGKTFKKEAEEKIFPKKLAEFFASHKNISLTSPDSSDYQALFKNIRIRIYTVDRGVLKGCDLLIREGKITGIAQNIQVNDNLNTINLQGKSIIPEIIDSHTHIGLYGEINEMSKNITPEVKMEFQLNTDSSRIYYALTGGVTMVHTMHGSSNPIGGENVTIKLKWGKSAEEMIEKRASRTLKMALGENPKTMSKTFPNTRMGVSAAIESAYKKALNTGNSGKITKKNMTKHRNRTGLN